MRCRWLVRLPCLLALALVIAVWVASHVVAFYVTKQFPDRFCWGSVVQGLVDIVVDRKEPRPDHPFGFGFSKEYTTKDLIPVRTTLGIYGGRRPGMSDSLLIVFPLWLPTLVLLGLNWFVWRKTRPTYNGKGFPVEVDVKGATKT
jgi:hypothetical protein